MKKLFLTSAIIAVMSCPAIALDGNNHIQPSPTNDCVETTLGTATGPANLEADWTANTINLEWYNEDTKLTVPTTSNTCTYDGGITLPSTNPTKTGYTFRGWQVRAAASVFDLSTWDYKMPESLAYGTGMNFNQLAETSDSYTLAQLGIESDEELNNGEWSSRWLSRSDDSYGKLKGISTCATSGNDNSWSDAYFISSNAEGSILPSDALTAGQYSTDTNSNLKYCWCKVTSADTGNGYQTVNSAPWVYVSMNYIYADVNAYECASNCAAVCSSLTDQYMVAFRNY